MTKAFAVLPLTVTEYEFIQKLLEETADNLMPRGEFRAPAIDLWDKINALPFDRAQSYKLKT